MLESIPDRIAPAWPRTAKPPARSYCGCTAGPTALRPRRMARRPRCGEVPARRASEITSRLAGDWERRHPLDVEIRIHSSPRRSPRARAKGKEERRHRPDVEISMLPFPRRQATKLRRPSRGFAATDACTPRASYASQRTIADRAVVEHSLCAGRPTARLQRSRDVPQPPHESTCDSPPPPPPPPPPPLRLPPGSISRPPEPRLRGGGGALFFFFFFFPPFLEGWVTCLLRTTIRRLMVIVIVIGMVTWRVSPRRERGRSCRGVTCTTRTKAR